MKSLKFLISEVLDAFRKHDARRLRKLNDEALISAAVQKNQPYLKLAIFSYVLSKLVSKPRFTRSEMRSRLERIERILVKIMQLPPAVEPRMLDLFSELEKTITALENEDPRFIMDLMKKGRLKMAATLYAQGLSLGVASEMLSLEKQEILDYAGDTMMFDRMKETDTGGVIERFKKAKRLIGE